MKKNMYILDVGSCKLAFPSMSAATTAMVALTKGIEIDHDPQYEDYEIKAEDDSFLFRRMKLYTGKVTQPKAKKTLALPAPKRNTVPCSFCESVSVQKGTNCQSCGGYAP